MSQGSSASVAAVARLRHDYDTLRAWLPQVLASAKLLEKGSRARQEHELRRLTERQLGPFRDSLKESPFWVDRLRSVGTSPTDLCRLEDLAAFPTLTRADLRDAWDRLPAFRADQAAELVAIKSSGSTGEPVNVVKDTFDCLHMWAVLRFWMRALAGGVPRRPRVALLCALPGGLEYDSRLPVFGDGRLSRISTVRERPLERLLSYRPHVLFSDPAGLHWLASRPRLPAPRLVLTSAQYFGAEQRAELATRLSAPVVNYYSTSETGAIAWECPEADGRFHVLAPEIFVESVGGELLVTRLRRSVLPILRYRTGDRGEVRLADCPCGRFGWVIDGFAGRRHCAFFAPNGAEIDAWQLAWVFKYHNLDDFCLTQCSEEEFALEIAASSGARELDVLLDRLGGALQNLGWRSPRVELRVVEAIRTRGQKPEPFRVADAVLARRCRPGNGSRPRGAPSG